MGLDPIFEAHLKEKWHSQGCQCDPHIEFHHPAPGIQHLSVHHDHDCPLLVTAKRVAAARYN